MINGETIRQTALEREKECPEGMKNSFYYGFREGAKWMQNENPLLKDVADHKAIIVDKGWLEQHEKSIRMEQHKIDVEKAWKYIKNILEVIGLSFTENAEKEEYEEFKQAMEE